MGSRSVDRRKNGRRRRVRLLSVWHSPALLRGLTRFAREAGWVLDPVTMHRPAAGGHGEQWLPEPDGLLTLGMQEASIRSRVEATDVPVVEMSEASGPRPVGRVCGDLEAQGRLAGEALAKLGHHHFAFAAPGSTRMASGRCGGLRQAVEASGGTLVALIEGPGGKPPQRPARSWMDWLTERIAALPSPSAIVGVSDETAVYVLEACRAAGRPVPEQLAVAGFDNDELACDHAVVPLSTVDTNLEEMAYRAAALLDDLMAGRPIPDAPILIPPKGFVTRQSSDLIAVDHTEVARALRVITDRFSDPNLTIARIVAETAISRRNLDRAFLSRLGRTITGELTRVRLGEARRLLAETKLSVQRVAEARGFSGDKQLRQTLHRELGMTPKQYRRRAASA